MKFIHGLINVLLIDLGIGLLWVIAWECWK